MTQFACLVALSLLLLFVLVPQNCQAQFADNQPQLALVPERYFRLLTGDSFGVMGAVAFADEENSHIPLIRQRRCLNGTIPGFGNFGGFGSIPGLGGGGGAGGTANSPARTQGWGRGGIRQAWRQFTGSNGGGQSGQSGSGSQFSAGRFGGGQFGQRQRQGGNGGGGGQSWSPGSGNGGGWGRQG